MKQIPLTQNQIALVSDEDYPILNHYNWCAMKLPRTYYAARWDPATKRTLYMHRQIMGVLPGFEVDHKDLNGLNCQRRNLRVCTKTDNRRNKKRSRSNTSGFKGVSWRKGTQKWLARIGVNGHDITLGYFENPVDAAKAYNAAALKYHGAFARLNPIPS